MLLGFKDQNLQSVRHGFNSSRRLHIKQGFASIRRKTFLFRLAYGTTIGPHWAKNALGDRLGRLGRVYSRCLRRSDRTFSLPVSSGRIPPNSNYLTFSPNCHNSGYGKADIQCMNRSSAIDCDFWLRHGWKYPSIDFYFIFLHNRHSLGPLNPSSLPHEQVSRSWKENRNIPHLINDSQVHFYCMGVTQKVNIINRFESCAF